MVGVWYLVPFLASARLALCSTTSDSSQSPLLVEGVRVSLPVNNPTKSFWLVPADANPLANEGSNGTLTSESDICIIGSGISGVSTAWHLSKLLGPESEDSIVILEAREFCSGATGRNGGHLTPNPFNGFVSRQLKYGTLEALKSYDIERYTTESLVDFIRTRGLDEYVDLVNGNHTTIFRTSDEEDEARRDWDAAKAAGLDVEKGRNATCWVSNDELHEGYGLNRNLNYTAVGSIGYNLWPAKLVNELYKDIGRTNPKVRLRLHTHTPVTTISKTYPSTSTSTDNDRPTLQSTRRWTLSTPRGDIGCDYIVHATNAYAGHLLPFLGPSNLHDPTNVVGPGPYEIVPTRGQVGAVRSSVGASQLKWLAAWDGGGGGWEYWFPRYQDTLDAANESKHPLIILGGGREHSRGTLESGVTDDSSLNPFVTEALRKFLPSYFPEQFDEDAGSWEMEWTGIMGFTKSADPFVGPIGPLAQLASEVDVNDTDNEYAGQYISAGHTGHGMPRTFACAEAVAGMIAAEIQNQTWEAPEWLPQRYLTSVPRK